MKVAYHSRNRQTGVSYDYYDKPMQLARDVKILVVACPGGKETQRIVAVKSSKHWARTVI